MSGGGRESVSRQHSERNERRDMKEKARRNSDKNDDADGVNKLAVMRVIERHKKATQ